MDQLVSELMRYEFDLSSAKLREDPSRPLIVLNSAGDPYKIIYGNAVFPAIVITMATSFAQLAVSRLLVRTLYRASAGLLIMDDDRIIGFVDRQSVLESLLVFTSRRGDEESNTSELYGDAIAVSDAVRIRCLTCDKVGSYPYYLPSMKIDCANGHLLVPDLD